ncbi:hypothetical protein GCM10023149_39320 [Mucilaginibacter gynuensis]|uniref:Uncharacterized protein n=1 Tax=Mucilaginibacter gynuensis TaxID=1302236 RepID=A0ABP8H0X0_9SPHI
MRLRLFAPLLLAVLLHCNLFAQTITYNLPDGFKNTVNTAEYKTIVDTAITEIAKRYKIDNVKNGTITLASGQGMQVFNLDNLILKCSKEADHSKWPAIIKAHFNAIFSSIEAQKGIDAFNYDKIKPYLSVRIYNDATIAQRGGTETLVARTDLAGTKSLLMLDLPDAFTPVSKKQFEAWQKHTDDVFTDALANVANKQMASASPTIDIDGAKIEFTFLENEDYAASYALNLAINKPALVGEWGSVVAIPNKGLISICKISKAKPVDFVKFIQRMLPLINKSYSESTAPVSNQFFWYYQGKFTVVPVTVDDKNNVHVATPPGLSALMTEK